MDSFKELRTIIEICDGTRGPEDFASTPFETIQRHAEKALALLPAQLKVCQDLCKLCMFYEGCEHVFEHKAPVQAEDAKIREAFESGYARGHCDTVEGCVVEYEEAATEYLRDLAKKPVYLADVLESIVDSARAGRWELGKSKGGGKTHGQGTEHRGD